MITVDTRTYEVVGADERMLALSTDLRGPRRAGRVFAGFTDWSVHWVRANDGACVRFDAVVTLPLWRPPPFGSTELIARWTRFREAIVVHERGHVAIGLAAARALAAVLAETPPRWGEWADVARAVVAPYLDVERQYDAATGHGATQGAVLNPRAEGRHQGIPPSGELQPVTAPQNRSRTPTHPSAPVPEP